MIINDDDDDDYIHLIGLSTVSHTYTYTTELCSSIWIMRIIYGI